MIASNARAATSDRKLATCQPVSDAALNAAPPVENRTAALTSSRRWRTVGCNPIDYPGSPAGYRVGVEPHRWVTILLIPKDTRHERRRSPRYPHDAVVAWHLCRNTAGQASHVHAEA